MTKGACPTIFLDRDGVINVPTGIPHTYITKWDNFIFLPKVPDAIRLLNDSGFRVVVVTNQRGVARGALTSNELEAIHSKMLHELSLDNAHIDNIYACEHEGGCACRKPLPGLLVQADNDCTVDKSKSFMIGDSETDILAAHAFGIKSILLTAERNTKTEADYICKDLYEAARAITEGELA